MPVQKALKAYKEEKLNCAQSVLRAFQESCKITEEQILEAKKLGGGKAEGGLCGALYSACLLAADDHVKQELHERFTVLAGSVHCREIRKLGQLSCGECIVLAATVLHTKTSEKQ